MKKTKILIVEDEAVIAQDIKITLEDLGYTVCAIAVSAKKAVERAGRESPDLILMDIVLRGKTDGIEAADKIRSRYNIPVVYLTSYTDDKLLERAKITEPFGYIIKPYDEKELHSNIEMALYRHKIEIQLQESEERFRDLYHGQTWPSDVLTQWAYFDQRTSSEASDVWSWHFST